MGAPGRSLKLAVGVELCHHRSAGSGKAESLGLYTELKRRNVFRVAIVYTAVAWLLLQISDTLGPALHLPEWFVSGVAFLLILGFPVAIVLAWAFELTPDGLKAETKSDAPDTGAGTSSKQLNFIVVAALVMALGYFVIDQVLLNEGPETLAVASRAGFKFYTSVEKFKEYVGRDILAVIDEDAA